MTSILYQESDHTPRAVFSEFLRNEGFVVLEAADMAESLRACDEYPGPVDVAILSAKQGTRLIEHLAPKYAGLRVLFLGAPEAASLHVPAGVSCNYLQEPFTAEELLDAVRRITSARTVRAGGR
jgi:DNA-binding response OmpR family regulator